MTRRIELPLPPDTNGCWIWPGVKDQWGYGKSAGTSAHRRVYTQLRGPIPDGLELDHLCRVPPCVNPDHLEPVTSQENRRRKYAALTHCKNGHRYDAPNTYIRKNGTRDCRSCIRERVRAYKARKQGS